MDPHSLHADPDPPVFLNADPDPAVFLNADLDPHPGTGPVLALPNLKKKHMKSFLKLVKT